MRRKSLSKAKLVVTVESYKGKPIAIENPHITIRTISVFDTRINEFWSEERIKERGIEGFMDLDDLKETLNWNLNGDSSQFQFVWGQSSKTKSEGKAYIFQ